MCFLIFTGINKFLFLAVLVVIVSQNINADNAPIIQPGAPGKDSKILDPSIASNIAGASYVEADVNFLKAVVNTIPVTEKKMLAGIKDLILYAEGQHELELYLTGFKSPCSIQTIDPRTGKVVNTVAGIEGGIKKQFRPTTWPAIIWVSSK